ncbi:MAG: hypothetical protein AB2401_09645, partial [Bacillus sp. (in: firmicutes)]
LLDDSTEDNYSNKEEITEEDPEVNQDQTSDSSAEQVQDIEGEYDLVDQDQTANNNVCQDQTVEAPVTCHDSIESDVDGQIGQGQTTNLAISQEQELESTGSIDAEQWLKAKIDSEQSQEVNYPSGESDELNQGTIAETEQGQIVTTSESAEVKLEQDTNITVSQLQDFNHEGDGADEQEQLTEIDADQKMTVDSAGAAVLEQVQNAIVEGYFVNTLMEVAEIGVKVTTQNYVEVIQDAAGSFVKFAQKIFVNDQLIDDSQRTTALKVEDIHGSFQSYEEEFDWGTLIVKNVAVLFVEDLATVDYKALLKSSLSLIFGAEQIGAPVTKPIEEPPGEDDQEEPTTPPDDNNEEEPTPPEEPPTTPTDDNGTTPDSGETPSAPTEVENNSAPPVTQVIAKAAPVKTIAKTTAEGNELPNTATNQHN